MVALSGSGKIAISVTAENLKGKLSCSGKMELKGAVENTSLQLSGWGIITASALESQEAKVKISGSGRIEVYAQVILSIQISGSGTVKYKSDNEKTASVFYCKWIRTRYPRNLSPCGF